MSSSQRKRPGGAVDSTPAQKRSRLLPSSAGETSQTEPRDLEQSGAPAFEPEAIDLTGESSEPEVIITSDDESAVRQRKRPGGAVDSTPAQKRSRLLPSSAGETSQTEPRDLEQSGAPAFEPEAIDLTGESSEPEVIITSDDESAVDREQSQQQPHLFRASENSAEPLARDDEEEPREDDGDWLIFDFDYPYWSDEDSEDREQNQQQSHLSRSAENSAGPLTARDEEEPRAADDAWPACSASTPAREDEDSEVQHKEQSQQYPFGSIEAETSAEPGPSGTEEEPRDNDDSISSSEWPDRFESPRTWQDDITDDWEGSQQYPLGSRSAENSFELLESNLQQEPRDIEFYPPGGRVSPPDWEDDNAELPEVYGEERRNVTLNSPGQVDGCGNGPGANDAPVAGPAPAEQESEEEEEEEDSDSDSDSDSDTQSSDAQQGVVIWCPICMDDYSEMMRHGRQLVATLCGHVFCSRCLPIALETSPICPICRVELAPDLYVTLYI